MLLSMKIHLYLCVLILLNDVHLINSWSLNDICSAINIYDQVFQPIRPLEIKFHSDSLFLKKSLRQCLSRKGINLNLVTNISQCDAHGLILHHNYESISREDYYTDINQRVYFLDVELFQIFERYTINNVKLNRMIGKIMNQTFVYENGIRESFLWRRRNFYGVTLKVMTENKQPIAYLDPNYKSQSRFHGKNQTYEVTNQVQGVFIDVLNILQKSLNFSTKIYKRLDGVWGMPNFLPNGTISVNGMVGNLYRQEVDLIVASLGVFFPRILVIDYLQPITEANGGIYIRADNIQESFDFRTYLVPLNRNTWLCITVSCILISLFVSFFKRKINNKPQSSVSQIILKLDWLISLKS